MSDVKRFKQAVQALGPNLRYQSLDELRKRYNSTSNYKLRDQIKLAMKTHRCFVRSKLSIRVIDHLLKDEDFTVESGTFDQKVDPATSIDERETLQDTGGFIPYSAMSGVQSISSNNMYEDSDPNKFFKRPILIASFTVTPGSLINNSLSVWDLYTQIPSVRAKLRNYAYLKGTLMVRVAVSASPFHMGRLLISYQPFASSNLALTHIRAIGAAALTHKIDCNYLSQAPGCVSLDVRSNQPVDMEIPMISPAPMLRLFNAVSPVADTDPYDDFEELGELFLQSIGPVLAMGSNPGDVTINVYAWMVDYNLAGPTATIIDITAESGKMKKKTNLQESEQIVGPIQRISTNALKVFDILSPIMPPFLLPSRVGLSLLKDVSTALGWSRPCNDTSLTRMRQFGSSSASTGIGWDSSQKLSIDPSQELAINPTVCGINKDDLIIADMAMRETYLTTFEWEYSDTVNTKLFQCAVTPCLATYADEPIGTRYAIQPTAAAFACGTFEFWRGDVIFRFEVVCTSFHRGKLALIYEPNATNFSSITAVTSLNKQHMVVVDLQETTEFEVRIPWCNNRQWCRTSSLDNPLYTPRDTVKTLGTFDNDFHNGVIYLIPFNILTSSDTTTDTFVNVYTRVENLQVNQLTDRFFPFNRDTWVDLTVESGRITSLPVTNFDMFDNTSSTDTICVDHFGEQVLSFRLGLKRYCGQHRLTIPVKAAAGNSLVEAVIPILPPGNLAPGSGSGSLLSLYDYLHYAYLGKRGSRRLKISPGSFASSSANTISNVTLEDPTSSDASASITAIAITDEKSLNNLKGSLDVIHTFEGMSMVEAPYYTNNLFSLSLSNSATPTVNFQSTYTRNIAYRWFVSQASTLTNDLLVNSASGEDFSFMRFQGAVYYTGTI